MDVIGKKYKEANLITPTLIVSLPKLLRNCKKILNVCDDLNISLRPHIKTHKTIKGAICQIYGSTTENHDIKREKKITVSTLNEALFYAENGFKDILYSLCISPNKLHKAHKINQMIPKFSLAVDSLDLLNHLLKFSQENKTKWNLFVTVDCGYHREGVDIKHANELIMEILRHEEFNFMGLYTHAGNSYGSQNIESVSKQEIEELLKIVENEKDFKCPLISFGSTPTVSLLSKDKELEMHPGNYIFYDLSQFNMNACKMEDISVFVLTSVTGIYKERKTILIDTGALALSKDTGVHYNENHSAYGYIEGYPHLQIVSLSQEVGIIKAKEGHEINFEEFYLGKLLKILPNHSCLTAAHYDKYLVINEDDVIVDIWETCKRDW